MWTHIAGNMATLKCDINPLGDVTLYRVYSNGITSSIILNNTRNCDK